MYAPLFPPISRGKRPGDGNGSTRTRSKAIILENERLTLSLTSVTASDVDGDSLYLVISSGSNYTVSGSDIIPGNDFNGTLSIGVAVTDGTDTIGYKTMTVTVIPVADTPVIAWSTPADIVYGTALSATQLNAVATYGGDILSGTFTYSPAPGAILEAGTRELTVTFTPGDASNYVQVTDSVYITVTLATAVEVGEKSRASVSPNPSKGTFTVGLGEAYPAIITLVNTLGQELLRETASTPTLTVSKSLPAGVYTLLIQHGGTVTSRQVVIQE